ncbi:LamG-like jellyroll fold domain-containing protein [Aquibacillus salsiterrae]|uniref:Family 43 glycosylhydrolase n=1 Tax=Aquibacillus salsiterrae TaxID=2950439 RepID=A0A9X4AEJ3_9BACI|nr:LamG-like jellyroll fold domain-containing protein [Aquibacillus salsiterrae]MDC3416861.1 family 43 glycosylhydrolase [Aquibacillus salsiterrae]
MSNKFIKTTILVISIVVLTTIVSLVMNDNNPIKKEKSENDTLLSNEQVDTPQFKPVSVHDPSIIKADDMYYVFGTHIEAAKSKDLMNWTRFTNGYATTNNKLYGNLPENLAESFQWAGQDDADSKGGFAVWAADIFWNDNYVNGDGTKGAYMIYYSVSSTYIRSAIGYAVSKNIEGPYQYVDTVVYSGFTQDEAYDKNSKVDKKWTNTNIQSLIDQGSLTGANDDWFNRDDSYNNQIYPNAIDANLFYDTKGKLWMVYGSWSGGIFALEIDEETGQGIYPGVDGETEDGRLIDSYFGTKISGGYGESGEGPYVIYDEETKYFYLYVTYGWLGADGGYNMRVFRSKSPIGPYLDAKGQNAVLSRGASNVLYGNKLMGNFLFDRKLGEPGKGIGVGYVSPGHNSVLYDEQLDKKFIAFHTRFPNRGEAFGTRVHPLFMNKSDWPVVAPYSYTTRDELSKVTNDEITGSYKFINHGKDTTDRIKKSELVVLNDNSTISGAFDGTWKKVDDYYVELKINKFTYEGVFVKQWDPASEQYVMTFTAVSNEGVTVWGSKMPIFSDEDVVSRIVDDLKLKGTNNVTEDLELPTEAIQGTTITWESSDENIISSTGEVNRPDASSENVTATLTATVTKGDESKTKSFEVTILPNKKTELVAYFAFEDNLSDTAGDFGEGNVTGDRINNTGGSISYSPGESGKAAVFNGQSGVRLPSGLISSNSYSVSYWVNPEQITPFTTTFFGARNSENWISFVLNGPVDDNTMVWSGSSSWYDASTGLTVGKNKWTHLAMTVDSGKVSVYIDGNKKFTGDNFPNVFTSDGLTFGLGVNWWDPPFKGMIDELKIYQGVLSTSEIEGLANGNK